MPLFTLVDSNGTDVEGDQIGLLLYKGGTVCDDNFNTAAAEAICIQIGYKDIINWTSQDQSFVIQSDYEINLDNVNCSSAEWDSCRFSEEHDCLHSEDVFLSCTSDEDKKRSAGDKFDSLIGHN